MEAGKFNRLTVEARADIVWQQGKFVDSVMMSPYCLMLYSIHDQFIELSLDLRSQSIVWISIANEHDLSKYLRDVTIAV